MYSSVNRMKIKRLFCHPISHFDGPFFLLRKESHDSSVHEIGIELTRTQTCELGHTDCTECYFAF